MNSTVLIVDDEQRNRDLLKAVLKPSGYQLEFAENGHEAIAKTVKFKPDLILLDVMMPDMSGFEVCEAIRKSPTTVDIPVFMVTALDDRDSRIRGIEAGADDFISKPVDAGEMRMRVKNITQLNRYRRIVAEREKFQRIAEFSTDGFLLLDDSDRIQYANPRAAELLGGNADEFNGKTFTASASDRYVLKPPFAWKTWAGTADPDPKPVRYLLAKSGTDAPAKWLKTQLFLLPATGDSDWLVRLADISDSVRERRESWSFHRALTEKLNPSFGEMNDALDLLANPDAGMNGERRSELAKTARKQATQIQSQISDLMDFVQATSRLNEGDPVKIRDIRYKVKFMADALGLFGVHTRLPYEMEGKTLGINSRAFDTILSELMVNATKFHPRRSPAVEVEVMAGEAEGSVLIEVRDDGKSLSEDALAKARQPYYQDDSSGSNSSSLGLGLAMVASMLWELGGDFQLTNRDTGKGVVASIALPLR